MANHQRRPRRLHGSVKPTGFSPFFQPDLGWGSSRQRQGLKRSRSEPIARSAHLGPSLFASGKRFSIAAGAIYFPGGSDRMSVSPSLAVSGWISSLHGDASFQSTDPPQVRTVGVADVFGSFCYPCALPVPEQHCPGDGEKSGKRSKTNQPWTAYITTFPASAFRRSAARRWCRSETPRERWPTMCTDHG